LVIARRGALACCESLTKLPRLSSRRADAASWSRCRDGGSGRIHAPLPVPHFSRLRSVAIPCLPGASVDTTPNTIVFESTKISLEGSLSLGKTGARHVSVSPRFRYCSSGRCDRNGSRRTRRAVYTRTDGPSTEAKPYQPTKLT
jgi:hypothetical protein